MVRKACPQICVASEEGWQCYVFDISSFNSQVCDSPTLPPAPCLLILELGGIPTSLRKLLENESVIKAIHDGRQDLGVPGG